MPRFTAPQPHDQEFHVALIKPFSGPVTQHIEVTGQPNGVATIVRRNQSEGQTSDEKTGEMSADDTNELLRLVHQLTGFPSDDSKDIYGLNLKLEVQTPQISWGNGEVKGSETELEEETKGQFKDVADSIEAAARQFAKADRAI